MPEPRVFKVVELPPAEKLWKQTPPICRLLLPVPPSTNNLFVNKRGGGRARAAVYRSWLIEAGWEIKLQRPPALCPALRTCLRVLIMACRK